MTKINDRVRVAITEAFRELAGDEVPLTREALQQWIVERQKQK